jgi:hypothetical protein
MSFIPINVTITRGGTALTGSPFSVRRYIGRSGPPTDTQLQPNTVVVSPRTVISFETITTPVDIGDTVQFPDASRAIIVNVRPYDYSLQCDVQVIPTSEAAAALTSSLIILRGDDFTLPGNIAAKAIVKPINITSLPGYIPDGSANAANADPHVAHLPASAIHSLPESATVHWDSRDWTVVNTETPREGSVILQWDLYLIRRPVIGTSADDAAQEALFEYVDPTL